MGRRLAVHIQKKQAGRLFAALTASMLVGLAFPAGASALARARARGATSVPTAWHAIGPTVDGTPVGDAKPLAGRVSAVAVSPGRVRVELIGTLGGIWRRVDGGPWHDATNPRWPSTAIGSMVVDPTNPNVLYAGTGYDDVDDSSVQPGYGILKSTNAGATWSALPASEPLLRGYGVTGLAVDPRNHQIVVAATNGGLFRSTDGGGAWSKVLAIQPGTYVVAEVRLSVDPVTGVMLAGVAQSGGFKARFGPKMITTGHGVFRSTDGGRTWLAYAVDSGTGGGDAVVPGIGTAKGSSKTYAYALDVTGDAATGMYVSSNGGQSWVRRSAPDVTAKASIAQLVVDPRQPTHAYFALGDGPYEYIWGTHGDSYVASRDGSYPQFGDWRALTIGPAGNNTRGLYGGTDGGPCMYNLNTRHFFNQSAGLTSGIDYFGAAESASTEASGAQDLGVDVYHAAKVREMYHADAYGILIDRKNPSAYYAGIYDSAGNTEFVVSHDSGASWKPVALPSPQPTTPFSMRLEQASGDPNVLILPQQNGTMYVSSDDGRHWSARTISGLSGDYLTVVRAARIPGMTAPVIYAGTGFGQVWRSTTLGASWTELSHSFNLSVTDIAIDASASTGPLGVDLYVALGIWAAQGYATYPVVGDVQESTDSGSTWQDIGQELSGTSVNALLLDGPALLAGTDNGLRVYGGGHWTIPGGEFPNVRVNDLFQSNDGRAFFATTYGRGTWEATAGT